jgi:hypothetical protein
MARFDMAFLDRFPPVRGLPPTHTLIAGGSMYVHDDDRDDFEARYLALLRRAQAKGAFPCFTERPSPCWFPVIADVDVKVREGTAAVSNASDDAVGAAVAHAFARAIREVSGLAALECHLMRRSGPREGKYGAHAIFPGALFCRSGQRLIVEIAKAELDAAFEAGDFEAAGVTALVVDECYARNTNWQMYGSTKPALAGDPYLATATHAFAFGTDPEGDEEEVTEAVTVTPIAPEDVRDWPRWVALTRVRSLGNDGPAPLLPAFEAEARRREEAAAVAEATRNRDSAAAAERAAAEARPGDDPRQFDFLRRVLDCLSVERATAYDTWRNVGMMLRDFGPAFEPLWHTFSARAPNYDAEACDRAWASFDRRRCANPLTFKTLCYYAKQDSPDQLRCVMADRARSRDGLSLHATAQRLYEHERNRPCLIANAVTTEPEAELVQSGTAPCKLYFCAAVRSNVCTLGDVARSIVFAVTGERGEVAADANGTRPGAPTPPMPFLQYATGSTAKPAWVALGRDLDGEKKVRVTFQARVESFLAHRALAARFSEYLLRYWGSFPLLERIGRRGERAVIMETACYDTLARIPLPSRSGVIRETDFRALFGGRKDAVLHAVGAYDWSSVEGFAGEEPALSPIPFHAADGSMRTMCAPLHRVPPADAGDPLAFERMLQAWRGTAIVFPRGLAVQRACVFANGKARVCLKPSAVCPFASAAHEAAPSGTGYVSVDVSACRTLADVRCAHPACFEACCGASIELDPGPIPTQTTMELDKEDMTSLHCAAQAENWDEVYEDPVMRPIPFPDGGIVSVRAAMGAGEPEALARLVREAPAGVSVLAITFSIALAAKDAFELGLAHYAQIKGAIDEPRVV